MKQLWLSGSRSWGHFAKENPKTNDRTDPPIALQVDSTHSYLLNAEISVVHHRLGLPPIHIDPISFGLIARHPTSVTALPAAVDEVVVPGGLVAQRVVFNGVQGVDGVRNVHARVWCRGGRTFRLLSRCQKGLEGHKKKR